MLTSPLTGDYRKKKPASVKAADVAVSMTPVGSAVEIAEELDKEDPSYGKVAIIAAGDALGAAIPAMGPVAKSLIKQSDKVVDLKDVPTVEAAGLTDEAIEAWRKENATSDEFRKSLKGRNEELQDLAAGVEEGRVFTSTYRKRADELRPIRKVEEVPKPATFVEAVSALNAGKRKKPMIGLNASIPEGDIVTARLDIDAYTDYDVWVPTLTHPELKTVYKPSVILEDVSFIKPEGREPKKALSVAKGGAKAPFAVMTGKYVDATDDEAYRIAQDVFDNPEFTQVGYDPTRRGFFYDRETGEAIVEADTVVQVGHLVLARNAKKMDAEAFGFSEGGMALEDQMEMNFGKEVPENTVGVDPVSGNDIPLGATAENVRDDIPANLSEGEIVVPADVVNFHGVKLFEDLREEAKRGYAQMAQDGRMGGEPMMEDSDMMADLDIDLSVEDLQVMDDEEPVEMKRGGIARLGGGPTLGQRRRAAAQKTSASTARANKQAAVSKSKSSAAAHKAFMDRISKKRSSSKPKPAPVVNVPTTAGPTRPQLTTKPATSDDVRPGGQTIAEQINFGGDYEPRSAADIRALGGNQGDELSFGQKLVKGARELFDTSEDISNRFATEEEEEGINVRYYDKPFYQRFMEGIGFDEGGLVNPEPFYSQKGGFDLSHMQNTGTVVQEYMNDEGHRIYITFVDGVPQMEIPEGYYPVGEGVSLNTVVNSSIPTMDGISPEPVRSEGSDMGDDPSVMAPAPDPVNYKELSIDELKSMVSDQKSMGTKIFAGLSPLTKIIMWDQTRRTKGEIERRIEDPNTSEVDKIRLNNLLELMNREEPGLVKTLLDKATGKEFERVVSQIPKPVVPDVDYSDPTLAPDQGIYTPDPQVESDKKIPTVDPEEPYVPEPTGTANVFSDETIEAAKKISQEAAAKAFSTPQQKAAKTRVEEALSTAAPTEQIMQPDKKERERRSTALDFSPQATAAARQSATSAATRLGLDPTAKRGGRNKGGLATKKGKKKKSK